MPELADGRADSQATFGALLVIGEFRALWLAQALSVIGDQLARVALTRLVYDQTRSSLLAALTFAASVVPTFFGGIVLAGLADRLPRRQVMITCDLIRAILVLVMVVPGLPLALLVVLLFVVTMIGTPFTSARGALFPHVLPGDLYVLGTATTMTTYQFAQVFGFAAGGAAVGFFGVRVSLIADAATFAVSALIVWLWVRARPTAQSAGVSRRSTIADLLAGVRLVFRSPSLRVPMLLGWLAAFYNAPEGVAAPLATSLGAGSVAVGLILAAGALGAAVGAIAFSRLVSPARRQRWMYPLAVGACGVLTLFAFGPALPLTLLILFAAGLCDCYQVAALAAFVLAAPERQRSQALGLAQAGMSLGQGAAMITAGAAAQQHAPSAVIAVSGALGAAVAMIIAVAGSRHSPRSAGAEPG